MQGRKFIHVLLEKKMKLALTCAGIAIGGYRYPPAKVGKLLTVLLVFNLECILLTSTRKIDTFAERREAK